MIFLRRRLLSYSQQTKGLREKREKTERMEPQEKMEPPEKG